MVLDDIKLCNDFPESYKFNITLGLVPAPSIQSPENPAGIKLQVNTVAQLNFVF